MVPKLRVLAGTSTDNMVPITSIINTNEPHKLSSDLFEGEIVAHIKNFVDGSGNIRESEYFEREDRQGVTWSIQVRGRFLMPYSADDILFGNTFDRPLKLPWGTGAVLKFMNYIDPTLEHDLQSPAKPWALSPLVSTMPHLIHERVHRDRSSSFGSVDSSVAAPEGKTRAFPSTQSIVDSTPELYKALRDRSSSSSSTSSLSSASSIISALSSKSQTSSVSKKSDSIKGAIKKVTGHRSKKSHHHRQHLHRLPPEELNFSNATSRRTYFSTAAHRQDIIFGPSDILTTDFCYGFIEFSPSLALRLPGGLSFDLMRYWDGQPVRFVCCERKGAAGGVGGGAAGRNSEGNLRKENGEENPWGRIFWCIAIETYEDDEDEGEVEGEEGEEEDID